MQPETKALLDQLGALVEELRPNIPADLPPDQAEALAQAYKARFEARRPEMDALMERVKESAQPRKPRRAMPIKGQSEAQTLGGFERTHPYIAEKMLEVAELGPEDVLYDLGSGDGCIVEIAADIYRIQAGGVEIHPLWVRLARERAIVRGLKSYVDYMQADAETVDLRRATVVTLFLSPEGNLRIRQRLRDQLRDGARIISNRYDMGDWKPDLITQAKDAMEQWHNVYLWRIRKQP
jgi:hypothetical protein